LIGNQKVDSNIIEKIDSIYTKLKSNETLTIITVTIFQRLAYFFAKQKDRLRETEIYDKLATSDFPGCTLRTSLLFQIQTSCQNEDLNKAKTFYTKLTGETAPESIKEVLNKALLYNAKAYLRSKDSNGMLLVEGYNLYNLFTKMKPLSEELQEARFKILHHHSIISNRAGKIEAEKATLKALLAPKKIPENCQELFKEARKRLDEIEKGNQT
jgi:hypothetical protein